MSWPHILSFSRVVAGPVVAALILTWPGSGDLLAACIFGSASLTDLVDGKLARHSQRVSPLGVFLDTTADKILVSLTLIALAVGGLAPSWIVLLIIGRELLISGLRSYAASCNRIISAHVWGKGKAALTMAAIFCLLLAADGRAGGWFSSLTSHSHWEAIFAGTVWLLGLAGLLTVVSGLRYLVDASPLFTADTAPQTRPERPPSIAAGDRQR